MSRAEVNAGTSTLTLRMVLCQSFLRLDLVDEIRLAIMPALLGDGCTFWQLRYRKEMASEGRNRLQDGCC
jgi:riboflavin biosynthesis pyrimidine reductase